MTRSLTIWIAFIGISLASTWYAINYFPQVFTFVSVDIRMDRNQAIGNARTLATENSWGFDGETRDAASFSVDNTVQTYLELEAGGADVFAEVVTLPAWSPYLWTVRLFQENETAEVRIRFRPDGRPFGFTERVPEDETRPSVAEDAARQMGESAAVDLWQIDIGSYELIESGQHTRANGRVDHHFTYEKEDALLADARLQVHIGVSGNAVSQVQPTVKVPEAFQRRYEEMRSANTSIGLGGTVGIVIYVLLGCGFGCYYLLKRNALQWRAGAFFGVLIGALMAGYYINALPLAWMSYNTSLSAGNFLLLQVGQGVGIGVSLGAVMAVTFIAAEGLSRQAFPHHPQLWRVWSPRSGASATVAGQTITGYLMAPIMLAMLVTFYGVTGDLWGWWNPSDTLVSPDNLAHYAPWLSPFALSFHAGFWEECLMRAIPLAGAALIGERYGQRNLFIAIAFVAQAIVFGAAHAAYPAQPAYARLVELILPSFIFGALYLRYGLLPAVIMHYVYDIVLMSIPVFATPGDGVVIDRTLLLILALLPVLIVIYRRVQFGQLFNAGPAVERNSEWTPPAATPPNRQPDREVAEQHPLPAWLIPLLAGAAIVTLPVALWLKNDRVQDIPGMEITRQEAIEIARSALEERQLTLPDDARALVGVVGAPTIQDRFIWELSGEEAYQALVDDWLHPPRFTVRFARFEGDIAARAEEWTVYVTGDGNVRNVMHQLPEDAEGADLQESEARKLAVAAIARELGFGIDALKEVSVTPERHPNRTDWAFTFEYAGDTPLPVLPTGGQYRVFAVIAGDTVGSYGRYVYAPEEWVREVQGNITSMILNVLTNVLIIGSMVVAAIVAIVAWSRGQFPARVFWWTLGAMLVASLFNFTNNFTVVEAAFVTAQGYGTQVLVMAIGAVIGMGALSAALGLAGGLGGSWRVCRTTASDLQLIGAAVALGCLFVASRAITSGTESVWPSWPVTGPAGSLAPWAATMLNGVLSLIRFAIFTLLVAGIADRFSRGWTQRHWLAVLILFVAGGIANAGPSGDVLTTWALSACVAGTMLVVGYVLLARYDLAVIPVLVATVLAVNIASSATAFPHDTLATILGALVVFATGIAAFLLLRRGSATVS